MSGNGGVVVQKPAGKPRYRQGGFALIMLLAILVAGSLYLAVSRLDANQVQRERDGVTTRALAEARAALIAYAVAVDLSSGSKRPGDLPCPDRNDDGQKETSCGNAAGTTGQAQRIGRLPWKSLGLPDLRDGSGERLWYAVSNKFKENTRTDSLNSDTTGTITVRDNAGNILFDGGGATGVVAVIIAPGPPLRRQDGLQQDRSGTNIDDPLHYLDNIATEDNTNFVDGDVNGFSPGPVVDTSGNVTANDRIVFITRDEIMAAIEKRVTGEVMNCLANYAAVPANGGRYPWAADPSGFPGSNGDSLNRVFGRVPDLMCNTAGDGNPLGACPLITGTHPGMLSTWGSVPNCFVTNNWFNNWREFVFYAIADAYKPAPPISPPSCGTCLTVDAIPNKQVAVFLARKMIGTQTRIVKSDVTQYLEGENNNGDAIYVSGPQSTTFNDRVLYR